MDCLPRRVALGGQNKFNGEMVRLVLVGPKEWSGIPLGDDLVVAAAGMDVRQRGSFRGRLRACARASPSRHHWADIQNERQSDVEDREQPRQSRRDEYGRWFLLHECQDYSCMQDTKRKAEIQVSSETASVSWILRTSMPILWSSELKISRNLAPQTISSYRYEDLE